MNAPIAKITESIANDIMLLVQTVMGENGLSNSVLNGDVQVEVRNYESPVIDYIFDDYLTYIETGRKPCSGKMPQISSLRDWAIKKGIPADNSTLFLISRSIWRKGITSRPILATLEEEIEKNFMMQWADKLFDVIVKELDVYFR